LPSKVVVRSARNLDLGAVIRDVLEAIQWRDIVAAHARVVIKPNLCTHRPALVRAANTSAAVIEHLCRVLSERTTQITLVESNANRAQAEEAFVASGIDRIARQFNIQCVNLSKDELVAVDHPLLKGWGLAKTHLNADVFISVPKLKTHAIAMFTGALKNQFGCLPRNDRILLHRNLHAIIAEINSVRPPDISIMDGIVAMEGMGPLLGDPVEMNLILGSRDPVALDATAMRLVGLDPYAAKHVVLAYQRGLGEIDEAGISLDGEFQQHRKIFKRAKMDFPLRLYEILARSKLATRYLILNQRCFEPVRALGIQFRRLFG
jgi:uncharacterized protein (DUF362 family)